MLQLLLNSPIATIVAVIVAVGALGYIWYHCLPLMEEHKKLKEEHAKLQKEKEGKVGENLQTLLDSHNAMSKLLTDMQAEITKNPDRALERLQEALAYLKDGDKDNNTALNELRFVINSILESVQNTKMRDETMHVNINELLRYMYSINEKQNQIISALLGISKIQDNNRGIL